MSEVIRLFIIIRLFINCDFKIDDVMFVITHNLGSNSIIERSVDSIFLGNLIKLKLILLDLPYLSWNSVNFV